MVATANGSGKPVCNRVSQDLLWQIVAGRGDCEVKHTKYIAFVKPVRGDNYNQVSIHGAVCAHVVPYSSLEDWAGSCK
jgi:hypothetical protein